MKFVGSLFFGQKEEKAKLEGETATVTKDEAPKKETTKPVATVKIIGPRSKNNDTFSRDEYT